MNQPGPADPKLRAVVTELLEEHSDELNDWELQFVQDLNRGYNRQLTLWQMDKLEEIYTRCSRG